MKTWIAKIKEIAVRKVTFTFPVWGWAAFAVACLLAGLIL